VLGSEAEIEAVIPTQGGLPAVLSDGDQKADMIRKMRRIEKVKWVLYRLI